MYFETKAREYLDRRKDDNLSLAAANMLFKSLNMKMENFLNSPMINNKERVESNAKLSSHPASSQT